ncbi:NAD-dependent epimerase/dehydratase family protein [Synechococcus sp. UW179A]|uniref:NAD-dependent epimerase/dehydratase family protein n=1 Tax=Synechococcus sp. UW179A TaxID=2575510 RepID=UPI000E0F30F9|nr:NAD-dependent epimerase/dehydratase family protein [Synechococcus sp. UW179A]
MNLRALVTGGAGFIGGHIARDLISRGFIVDIIDNLKTGNILNIPDSANFFYIDSANSDIFRILNQSYDIIYHFAGQSSVEISYRDIMYDFNSNLASTVNILEFARKVKPRHLIYASSMSVYGGEDTSARSEDSVLLGSNPYALGKMTSEKYLQLYNKFGISSTAVRLFNIYGPGQNLVNLSQGMLSIYLAQALNSPSVLVKGSLDRSRDFVHIYDVLKFLRKIEFNELAFNQSVNICSGISTTVGSILNDIEFVLNKQLDITVAGSTPGDIPHMLGDTSKLFNITSLKASTTIRRGIQTMVEALTSESYYR